MKKAILLSLVLCGLTAVMAQSKFDSASYNQFYNKLFPGFSIDSTTKIKALSQEEKIEALSKVWYEAKFNFANFDLVPTLNWDSLYRAFIPKILATNDIISSYQVLQTFNQNLRDGHSRVIPPPAYFFSMMDNLPIQCKYLDGKVVVYNIFSSDKAYQSIKKGWIVEKIDGVPVQEYIQKNISPYIHFSTVQDSINRIYTYELFRGNKGSSVSIGFRDDKGNTNTQSFQRTDRINLPKIAFHVLPGNIGHLVINSFENDEITKMFDSLFNEISTTSALIIDIRMNGGGSSNVGYEVLGCLTDKPFYTSLNVLHSYNGAYRAWGNGAIKLHLEKNDWKPYKNKLYSKPVIVLTSGATYSAAEDFTVAFKMMQRGKIMGEPTGGSTGQPLGYNLPGGGIGFICTKRDAMPDGTEFVGVGIQPDIKVSNSIAGIRSGKDEVLEAAMNELILLIQ